MTGPEHYAEAERLAGLVASDPGRPAVAAQAIATTALVHATLALAAATAMAGLGLMPAGEDEAWAVAAGPERNTT